MVCQGWDVKTPPRSLTSRREVLRSRRGTGFLGRLLAKQAHNLDYEPSDKRGCATKEQ